MSKKPFDKFINTKESGAKKKERIRQEKKKVRQEKNAWFDEQKKLARERRAEIKNMREALGKDKDKERQKPEIVKKEERRPAAGGKPEKRLRERMPLEKPGKKPFKGSDRKFAGNKTVVVPAKEKPAPEKQKTGSGNPDEMPLNKFIAWCGVCGRRDAADLIKDGKVSVNGNVVTEPPYRVSQQDLVKVNGKKISVQKNLVYILLNKPKDYITTTDDPEGRKTVMDLIKNATPERVFPVGRLDRNTTGVLLLTNDGELAQRMTHPKYQVRKIYEVKVDKQVTKQQLQTIADGLTLEDGFVQPDAVAYADAADKSVIGIELHSGKNRIVRRIFEHMGFKVKNLDRVMYGNFTKKNVDRGKWRFLSEKEIRLLKHLNTSFVTKKSSTSQRAKPNH